MSILNRLYAAGCSISLTPIPAQHGPRIKRFVEGAGGFSLSFFGGEGWGEEALASNLPLTKADI